MTNFIDSVQRTIIDIRYEIRLANMFEDILEDGIEIIPDEWIENMEDEAVDEYGNIIGAYPIRYGPYKD